MLIGASRPDQLMQNIASLEVTLSDEQLVRLETATAMPLPSPYFIFKLPRPGLYGGNEVAPWNPISH